MYFVLSWQHNTIEAVLQRGEKLDDLVEKSEGLTLQSKAFYKTVSKITWIHFIFKLLITGQTFCSATCMLYNIIILTNCLL